VVRCVCVCIGLADLTLDELYMIVTGRFGANVSKHMHFSQSG